MKRSFLSLLAAGGLAAALLTGCGISFSQPTQDSSSVPASRPASSQTETSQSTLPPSASAPDPTWAPEPDDTGTLSAVEHALNGSLGWDEVPADELDNWLDSFGYDRTEDKNYPGLTTDILQGSWLWVEDGCTLTFAGDLCTVAYPLLNRQYTVPYLLINRSAEHKCPRLTILDGIDHTTGLTFYISGMTREDHISTTNFGELLRQ